MAITQIRKVQGTNDNLGGLLGIAKAASPLLNLIPVVGPGLAQAAPIAIGIAQNAVTDPNKKSSDLDRVAGFAGQASQLGQGVANTVNDSPSPMETVASMDNGAILLNLNQTEDALKTNIGMPQAHIDQSLEIIKAAQKRVQDSLLNTRTTSGTRTT